MDVETAQRLRRVEDGLKALRRGVFSASGFKLGSMRVREVLAGILETTGIIRLHYGTAAQRSASSDYYDGVAWWTTDEDTLYIGTGSAWQLVGGAGGAPPGIHGGTHENGSADVFSVAGLSGVLADDQPSDHATPIATHAADDDAHHALVSIGADAAHSLAGQVLSAVLAGAAQVGHVGTGAQSLAGLKTFLDGLKTDTINEKTAGVGVTIEGVLIREGLVDGYDISSHVGASSAVHGVGLETILHTGTGVKLTGAQSIAGVKTFTSIPVLPASDPTADNEAVRKAYVDLHILKSLLTTRGDMIRRGASAPERFAKGAEGTFLQMGANDPAWGALPNNIRDARVSFGIADADSTGQKSHTLICPAGTVVKVEVILNENETCGATSLIVDVHKVPSANKNTDGTGTTLYTTQGNRPTVSNGNKYANATLPDVTAIAEGDALIPYIDQVGTSVTTCTVVVTIRRS